MKSRAGRLLVVGGQKNEFSLVQAIYEITEAAGIGECQALVPDTLRKIIGEAAYIRYAPAAPSGSLGKAALAELLSIVNDLDGLIVGGNLTSNAETAVMVESLIREVDIPVLITEETVEILKFEPGLVTGNPKALVVTTMSGLFALANHHHMPIAIRPDEGVVGKIEILTQLMAVSKCVYLVFGHEILVGAEGETSLTSLDNDLSELPAAAIGVGVALWIQNQTKTFAALTTAAYILQQVFSRPVRSYSEAAPMISKALRDME